MRGRDLIWLGGVDGGDIVCKVEERYGVARNVAS